MNFIDYLTEVLIEGKVDTVLAKPLHANIPVEIKNHYKAIVPTAAHLDWVLSQHTAGNILPHHDIEKMMKTFKTHSSKLTDRNINQYGTVDQLHAALLPHYDTGKISSKEKSTRGTDTLYQSDTMTIKQHHNYESAIRAAILPDGNIHKSTSDRPGREKAGWCISVGNGGGAAHYSKYTENGFHPVYTIEHHHPDGTSSRHMLVYNFNKRQSQQELRNENDHRPGFSDYGSTRDDLLDHYGKQHEELLKTPIATFFTPSGREAYETTAKPAYEQLSHTFSKIPRSGMNDDQYNEFFKEGLKKQHGGIHSVLANVVLNDTQLDHLIEHGNEGSKHHIANRRHLTDLQTQKLSNTNNMLVHHNLLMREHLDDTTFDNIMNKAHSDVIPAIISHGNFNIRHLEPTLRRNMSNANLAPIVNGLHRKLEPHHITALIDKGNNDTHYELLNRIGHKMSSTNIDSLIKGTSADTNPLVDRDTPNIHRKLISTIPDLLEPHHISALMNTGNIRTQVKLIDKVYDKLEPHHIKTLTDSDDDDIQTALKYRIHDKLEPEQIKTLIYHGDGETHRKIIDKIPNKLDPLHITALINNGDDTTYNHLIRNMTTKLRPEHISNMIDKGSFNVHLHLMKRMSKQLDSDHITGMINAKDPDVHEALISSLHEKLKPKHISKLIEKGESDVHKQLINNLSDKLEPEHITALIHKNDYYVNTEIINKLHKKLNPTHIKALIDNQDSDVYTPMMILMPDKLDRNNISDMIKKGQSHTHTELMDIMPDKLEPHHINDIIADDNPYTHNHLLQKIPHKLEPDHIKPLVDNGYNILGINDAYNKLPTETKKVVINHVQQLSKSNHPDYAHYDNVHKHIATPLVEQLRNSAFRRLLQESLIR